jgi:hypothetical protein
VTSFSECSGELATRGEPAAATVSVVDCVAEKGCALPAAGGSAVRYEHRRLAEDVLRPEVAVNDPLVVRRPEARRDLRAVFDRFASRQRAAASRSRSVSPSSSSITA